MFILFWEWIFMDLNIWDYVELFVEFIDLGID